MVNSRLKILDISVESMECPNEDPYKKEEETFSVYGGRDNQITTCTKLLNIKHKFYGFSVDLIETINK